MACQTCDHTMQSVGKTVFWCPRCGSIRQTEIKLDHVPKLVERVREYCGQLDDEHNEWHIERLEALGIGESIRNGDGL